MSSPMPTRLERRRHAACTQAAIQWPPPTGRGAAQHTTLQLGTMRCSTVQPVATQRASTKPPPPREGAHGGGRATRRLRCGLHARAIRRARAAATCHDHPGLRPAQRATRRSAHPHAHAHASSLARTPHTRARKCTYARSVRPKGQPGGAACRRSAATCTTCSARSSPSLTACCGCA